MTRHHSSKTLSLTMVSPADEAARFAFVARVLLASIGLPMFIGGMIGNIVNSVLFTALPQLNKLSTSVFLVFSFIASELALLFGFLPQMIYRIGGSDPLTNYPILCKLRWYIGPLAASTALHCLCCAAINQYLVTSRRIRYHQWITRPRAYLISISIFLFWIGPLCPGFIFYTTATNSANVTLCTILDPIFAESNAYTSIIVYSVIPIVFLSIFSFLTWRNVRNGIIRRRLLEQTVTRLLLAQIIMVLFTTVPNLFNQLYFLYTRTVPKDPVRLAQESIVSSLFTLFVYSTYSCSFYVYIFTSKSFRETVRTICFQQGQRRPCSARSSSRHRLPASTKTSDDVVVETMMK